MAVASLHLSSDINRVPSMCRHQARLWECRVNKLNPHSAHRLRFQLGSHLIRIEEMWWGKHLESDCQRIHGEHIWNETSKCRPGKDLSVERSRQKNRENKGLGYVGRKKEGIKEQKEDQCCWNRRVSVWKRAGGELFRAHILKCGRKAFLAGKWYHLINIFKTTLANVQRLKREQ